jgi:hypothetical protein
MYSDFWLSRRVQPDLVPGTLLESAHLFVAIWNPFLARDLKIDSQVVSGLTALACFATFEPSGR